MKKAGKYTFILLAAIAIFILGYYGYKSVVLYQLLKSDLPHYSLSLFQNDTTYGYKLIPNNHDWYYQDKTRLIPVYSDASGHRVTQSLYMSGSRVRVDMRVAFAGDSYTFGEGCIADSTFAFSIKVNKSEIENLGVGGYGYVQMLESLKELLQRNSHVSKVIFQISPWLGARCNRRYLDASLIKVPVPYLYDTASHPAVKPPLYASELFSHGFSNAIIFYRNSPSGVFDFISYVYTIAYPLYANEFFHELLLKFLHPPTPVLRTEKSEKWALNELSKLKHDHNLDVFLLIIGYDCRDFAQFQNNYSQIIGEARFKVINADSALWNSLQTKCSTPEYENTFMHWNRQHTKVIDRHPNVAAHKIIAATINNSLSENP